MEYVFTRRRPPLLKDIEDPRSIDSANLKFVVGRAVWNTSREVRTTPIALNYDLYETKFDLERSFRWVIKSGPIHRAEDFPLKIIETKGYSVTQKNIFENTLEITVHSDLEIPQVKLSIDIKNTLKITDEITQDWKIETITETNEIFKAGTTYYKWALIERLHLEKTILLKHLFGTERHLVGIDPLIITQADFDCTLGFYDDKISDENNEHFSQYVAHQDEIFKSRANEFSAPMDSYNSIF